MNKGLGILGGSFNPPHIGHLRLAIEVAENFAHCLTRVCLIPCAHPPHKEESHLLPFAMRCSMLENACAGSSALSVSTIEGERNEPSYTWDTLTRLKQRHPESPLFFILGADDYQQIGTWYQGEALPTLTNFIVVPRMSQPEDRFVADTKSLWPQARFANNSAFLPGGGVAVFFQPPLVTISATAIRSRFLRGQSIRFLVPEMIDTFLQEHRTLVSAIWGK
ncbi:MAG: nicotinate (nicotinamide) nucleotide adenylyltransferase [Desulfovibrio sp.]|nr:nicotinate (nicotinamide) nucleotide adenylyltransferase [Desulfovibrio sp.]